MDARDWDERYREAELLWSAGPNRWVREYTNDLPAGRVLDLAAGEGRNALWLAEQGWCATAVDFSNVAIERGQELAERAGVDSRVEWVVADVGDYVPTDIYDLVLVIYLHVPADERQAVLSRAAAAVAPGGRLLVVGHHADNLTEGVGGPQDPALLYNEQQVLVDLAAERSLVTWAACRRERPVEGEPRPALDVVVSLGRTRQA